MKLRINGKEHSCDGEIMLKDFILDKNLKPERIVVEHNSEIVLQDRWNDVLLKEGDNLEIVSFVGGG